MERAFDRVLLARHFALSLGAIAAYLLRAEWQIGYVALWVVGISASLNFLAYAFGARPSMTRICMGASPVIGDFGREFGGLDGNRSTDLIFQRPDVSQSP